MLIFYLELTGVKVESKNRGCQVKHLKTQHGGLVVCTVALQLPGSCLESLAGAFSVFAPTAPKHTSGLFGDSKWAPTTTHHSQERPYESGAMWDGQWPKVGASVSQPFTIETAVRTWNVPSLVGKEHEVERYRLDIPAYLSAQHTFWTQSLQWGWTLFHPELLMVRGFGVGLLISPWLKACNFCLFVFSSRWEGSFPAPLGQGVGSDCCLCLCTKQPFRVPNLLGVPSGGTGKYS